MTKNNAGLRFRQAVEDCSPLQVVGTVNAYSALLAEKADHKALYLSGAGVANASFGLPDLGMTSLENVLEDARRITGASNLPLLVDIDTGWGGAFNIARTIKEMERVGVAAVHIEDQVAQKRCGHRPNKAIVNQAEMVNRIKAAVDARSDESFVIMARTDALAVDGMQAAIDRACACVEAGADMIFPEAITTLQQYEEFSKSVHVPFLANITEFGMSPMFTTQELANAGVSIVLYPLSGFRAMSQAALNVYQVLRQEGSQNSSLKSMQSRNELYEVLNYHAYEDRLDALFEGEKENG